MFTAQELYELLSKAAYLVNNVEHDTWEGLPRDDKLKWEYFAGLVNLKVTDRR